LTEEVIKWVRDGEGRRTTAQAVAKLGQPDRYEHIDFTLSSGLNWVKGDVQMVWEDRSELYPTYQGNQLTYVQARYIGVPTMSSLSPETALKLRLKMSPKEARLATREKNIGGGSTRLLRLVVHGNKYGVFSYPETYKEVPLLAADPLPVLPKFTRLLIEDLKKRKWKIADLLGRLGRPDRIELPHDGKRGPKGSTVLTWKDATEVEAVYEHGRTVRLVGRFSPRLPHAKVTAESFRKLNHGSTPGEGRTLREVQDLLGPPVEEVERVELRGNMAERQWQKVQVKWYGTRRVLEVFIGSDGKVADARLSSSMPRPTTAR
jgi:hypothetical protein